MMLAVWANLAVAAKIKPLPTTAELTRAANAPTPAEVSKPDATAATTKPSTLFNGWGLTPAGSHVEITAMPLRLVLSPDGQTLAGVCAALHPGVSIIDVKTQPRCGSSFGPQVLPRAFNGLCFSKQTAKKAFSPPAGTPINPAHPRPSARRQMGDGDVSPERLAAGDPIEAGRLNFVAGIAVHKRGHRKTLHLRRRPAGSVDRRSGEI